MPFPSPLANSIYLCICLNEMQSMLGKLTIRVDSLEDSDAGRDWGQEEKGTTEDEMAGWHH